MATIQRPLRLVLVEDADGYAALVSALLAAEPVPPEVVRFARLDAALRHLARADADCVLLDLELPDATGTEGIERVLTVCPELPIVVLTGHTDKALPVQVIRAGAQDLVVKGNEPGLMRTVRHAVERRRTGERQEVERLVRQVAADLRGSRPRRPRPILLLAAAAGVTAAISLQLLLGGAVPWVLFAVAAVLAWRASQRLQHGSHLLQQIVEGASDGVFVKDVEGRYVLANDAAATLIGRPREELIGRTDSELFSADIAAPRRARDEAVIASGEPRRYWRTVSGRTLSVVKTPHRDGEGQVIGLIGTVRDETVTRRLQEESSRFFDLAPDMLCTTGPEGRLERINDAWTAALGWTAEELRSRRLLDFLHPGDSGRELERLLAGEIDTCVNRLATKGGGWRHVEWTARAVPEDHRVYAVVRDVTDRNALAEALAAGDTRYRTLVQNIPNSCVMTFDHNLRFTFAEGDMLAAAGLDDSFVGRTLGEVMPPESVAELTPRYRAALGGHPQSFEFSLDGGQYWLQIAPLRDGESAITGGMLLAQEVTTLKHAQRDLAQAEERFRTAFEQAPIGMGLISPDGSYLRVNDALCTITGYTADELLQTTVEAITHPEDAADEFTGRAELIAGRSSIQRLEKRFMHAAGHPVWVSVHATLVRDADGTPSHILGQIVDITERRQFQDRLQHLVDHDPLTGLFNRRRFEQELDGHVARIARYGAEGALLVLDIDDFKQVNDTLGHHSGDELIVAVGRLLKAQLRDSDVIARLGGDEFAVLLPTGGPAEAQAVAAKLVHAVREHGVLGRGVTTSVGVATFGPGELSGEEMLVSADLAMYEAKEAGRDRYALYASGDAPQVETRLRWVERIRDALDEDRFVLHAQPIVDLRTGVVVQHELLVRMLDDDGELIPPGAFLPVAERSDLVQRIDGWVARRALELISEHDLRLTVNLSGRTLTDGRLLAELEREVPRTGGDPGRLTFEVTETAAVANIDQAREFAARLRRIGCRFALDDFGSGFGSFYYLKHLPFDYLKIDGEFITGCLTNQTDQLVIRAVVEIARGLGKETVAEFAADADLVEFLRAQGVDYAQGFHIGRPRPLDDLLASLSFA